jgi:hypothetical protein
MEAAMLESTSLTSLAELQQLLKNLNDRLTYIEKVVLPSRVTKEELHSAVGEAKIETMVSVGRVRREIDALRDQMATKAELAEVKQTRGRKRPTAHP